MAFLIDSSVYVKQRTPKVVGKKQDKEIDVYQQSKWSYRSFEFILLYTISSNKAGIQVPLNHSCYQKAAAWKPKKSQGFDSRELSYYRSWSGLTIFSSSCKYDNREYR
jgi:hypothetical protein